MVGAAQTTGSVNASIGGYGNIDLTNVAVSDSVAGSALNKVSPDVLIVGNNNTFTGQFNVTAPLDDYLLLIKAELQSEAR